MTVREKLLDLARSQLGVAEPYGDDKYLQWFNKVTGSKVPMTTPWCCVFVSWCLDTLGAVQLVKPFASCTQMTNWFKRQGRWYPRGKYTPVPGDIIMYDWDASGDSDHVGLVETVTKNAVTTIEGNYSDMVKRRTILLSSKLIRGFCVPDFPTGDVTGDGKTDARDAQKVLQAAVGKAKLNAKQKHHADVNLDGKVDAADALEILKTAVGK